MPVFAKYTITVEGGSLSAPVQHEFEANPGENLRQQEMLASNIGSGKYTVSLFIHVQYVTRDGTNRILNNSAGSLAVER